MKASQVREMSVEDLKISLKDNAEALENFRFRHAIGQLENYKSIPNTKKDIARIYTMLREKELNLNTNIKKSADVIASKPVKKVAKKVAKAENDEIVETVKEVKEVKKKVAKKVTKEEKE